MVLQEAWARHEVEKAPSIFEAHYNLAEMLQRRGALDEAIAQFQAAVSIRPNDPVANNALGRRAAGQGRPGLAPCTVLAPQSQPNPTISMRITTWGMRWPRKETSREQPSSSATAVRLESRGRKRPGESRNCIGAIGATDGGEDPTTRRHCASIPSMRWRARTCSSSSR